jgi:hypothetical protein
MSENPVLYESRFRHTKQKHMKLIRCVFTLSTLLCALSVARAELPNSKITEVKEYLKAEGYATKQWIDMGGGYYGCCSDYVKIGFDEILANNIAYYINGNETKATEINITLNVNLPAKAKDAHAEFLRVAQALYLKATGKKLEDKLVEAITKGSSAEVDAESYTTKLVRDDWPSGRGYSLKFLIK